MSGLLSAEQVAIALCHLESDAFIVARGYSVDLIRGHIEALHEQLLAAFREQLDAYQIGGAS